MSRLRPSSTLFPYTTLFRSGAHLGARLERFAIRHGAPDINGEFTVFGAPFSDGVVIRSEEHTSELQSRVDLVCRLLLEKKNTKEMHTGIRLRVSVDLDGCAD